MEEIEPHMGEQTREDVKPDEEWEPAPVEAAATAATAAAVDRTRIPSGDACGTGPATENNGSGGLSSLDKRIVEKLGSALEAVAKRNPDQNDPLFAGKRTPEISVTNYLKRILRYVDRTGSTGWANLSAGTRGLMCAVLYLDRLSSKPKPTHVSPRTVHRWIATAMLVALKMNEDARVELRHYSALVGISVPDLVRFEDAFLRAEFDLRVERFSELLSGRRRPPQTV
jgi:hypothetical protein